MNTKDLTEFVIKHYQVLEPYALSLVKAIIMLVVGSWLINRLVATVTTLMTKRHIDPTIRPFFGSLINISLKTLLFVSIAEIFGFKTTSFVAILSAATFAVGLALQGSLGHFASGVLLLIFKPYRVGDLVTLNNQTGTVEEIQIFNTVLSTTDNKRIMVPNGLVTSNIITNISGQGEIRVDLTVVIADTESVEKARKVAQMVANNCPKVISTKPVEVLVDKLKPGQIVLSVRQWSKSMDYWEVYHYMLEEIQKAFVAGEVKMAKTDKE
jgi:small conductance mechanosensitive channel